MNDETTRFDAAAPDREIIAWILNGEHVQAAWDALLARHSNLIYTVPIRHGLQESDARDVYQDVCEALWKDLADLRDPDRLAAWLLRVAVARPDASVAPAGPDGRNPGRRTRV